MKNPTLFDSIDEKILLSDLFELFDRHEKELVYFLEIEYGTLTFDEKLAVMLISCFVRAGHVCMPVNYTAEELARLIDLDVSITDTIKKTKLDLKNSSIIGSADSKTPLVVKGELLYLRRFFQEERNFQKWISEKSETRYDFSLSANDIILINSLFESNDKVNKEVDWQKAAAALSLFKQFLIISGGPGTGKTTTVARLLALQQKRSQIPLKIALAAPTGKAAGRMGEALFAELDKLGLSDEEMRGFPKEAQTIHRLLSGVEDRGLLPPANKKHLAYDIVIVDEASMIDLSLMNRLIKHLSDNTKLILLGDKDQLASVEAGSVFADICRKKENKFTSKSAEFLNSMGLKISCIDDSISGTDDSIVYLTKSYRFDANSGIGRLSEAVKGGVRNISVLNELFHNYQDIHYQSFDNNLTDFEQMTSRIRERVKESARISDPEKMLDYWKSTIWLSILRRGLSGTDRLNRLVEQTIAASRKVAISQGWYHGRPVIITRNDYDMGIFNGDHGVCIHGEEGLRVYIQSGDGIKKIKPERLIHYSPAYFLTVHKSQGSEFNRVNLLMPSLDTPIITKELLYTAITRAKSEFYLYGSLDLFIKGLKRSTERYSGF